MADETNPNPPDVNTQPAPAPQAAATISPDVQALIEAAKREAYNAGAATTRRAFEERLKSKESPKPEAPQPTATASPAPAVDVSSEIARLRTFDRALGRFDLPDAARDIIEADFNLAKPADPAAWIQARSEAYGWKRLGASTSTSIPAASAVTTPAPAPSGQPVVTRPASPVPPPISDDAPILSMTPDQRLALEQRIGNAEYVKRLFGELPRTRVV